MGEKREIEKTHNNSNQSCLALSREAEMHCASKCVSRCGRVSERARERHDACVSRSLRVSASDVRLLRRRRRTSVADLIAGCASDVKQQQRQQQEDRRSRRDAASVSDSLHRTRDIVVPKTKARLSLPGACLFSCYYFWC